MSRTAIVEVLWMATWIKNSVLDRANARADFAHAWGNIRAILAGVFFFAGGLAHAAGDAKPVALPPSATRAIDFDQDIKPLLQASCVQCHGQGRSKGEFRIDTRATFIKGGENGAAAIVGDSAKSAVVKMVAGVGVDEDQFMPKKGRKLSAEEVGLVRAWIDQGMKWPDGVSFAAGKQQPLPPRKVALPATADAKINPVDVLLAGYFAKHGVKAGAVVDDAVFARRVWHDVVGLLPPADELKQFQADSSPDKREKLVWRLLNDNQRYTEHWLSFWNDLLRNDYKGTGYIDGGRKQITPWLYKSLYENKPFNSFVSELVRGAEGSEGFTKGIVWRGVVNAAQTPQMQAAQNISQVFMGANLKCASCHDSFVSHWQLADAYGLAGVYADKPLEMERCNTPTGKIAPMKFLYPELGNIDANLPREKRLEQLAGLITSEKNGRLSRTIVNRFWKKFMGRAITEPTDDMDNEPWDADLLDWLAADLSDNGWDLKKSMARILTSKAYQMPVVPVAEGGQEVFVFRGPVVRRLSAEEFEDALSCVTGVWAAKAAFDPNGSAIKWPHKKARWIWSVAGAEKSAPPGTIYLRKEVMLQDLINGDAMLGCDNQFVLYVNGKRVAGGEAWDKPAVVELKAYLVSNTKNVIAVEATNTTNAPSPAGFFMTGTIIHRTGGARKTIDLGSDKSWSWSGKMEEGWMSSAFDPAAHGWKPAAELGDEKIAPWHIDKKWTAGTAVAQTGEPVRAALCAADPLMMALGRTNREQVMTDRPSMATTLQALELSNGSTLAETLRKGAAKLAGERGATADSVVEQVYWRGLGRAPSAGEKAAAGELVGAPVKVEGVEDLLWILGMLPEFQLVR